MGFSADDWGGCPPTEQVVPDYARTLVEECVATNRAGGRELFGWQKSVLSPWLAVLPNGRWAFTTLGNQVPRQNGKTVGVTCARAQYGMLKRWAVLGGRGERVLYTAHLQKTSTETFEFMADFFESAPEIRRRVKSIKGALGREQITMRNGGRIKFLARTKNGGRGQHADLLIFDEALELSGEEKASFLPVVSASPNPQTVYTSTPPEPGNDSEEYAAIRENALSGKTTRTVWHGWSVPELPPDDASADSLIEMAEATNPSLGVLIDRETIRSEIEQSGDMLSFAIERLGYWVPKKAADQDRAVSEEDWDGAVTTDGVPDGTEPDAYGVKFSHDGTEIAVAVCVNLPGDVHHHVELAADRQGATGTRWLKESMRRHPDAIWTVDGLSGATSLVEEMGDELGDNLRLCRTGDALSAASGLVSSLRDGEAEFYATGSDRLSASVAASTRRRVGTNGGWGFGGDSAPLEAAALALLGGKRAREDEGDEMEVFF